MTNTSQNSKQLLPWLRLCRVSALPSAVSNILMGYLLANGTWLPAGLLASLVLASAFFYTAGMIVNDVFDFEIDSELRPTRPLPAQQVKLETAKIVGFGFLVVGVAFTFIASRLASGSVNLIETRPIVIGVLLVVFICLYNVVLKRTPLAPIAMGICRGLNVLLGASTATASASHPAWVWGFSLPVWIISISLCILIIGLTWFARNESRQNQPFSLLPAGLMLLVGVAGFACMPILSRANFPGQVATLYPILILLVSITIIRRTLIAVSTGDPKHVQNVVVATLRSLIIFDASVCYLAAPDKIFYAVAVVCLLVPSLLLGRFIRST